ncbi:hypothetical protein EVAR_75979_1 [Eumeta japonica]|uniref:Uncharacterized protein n=1 Tax=Eumeta variegata TaxID=151549 RepID=A0A4C1UBF3_EUMVA|nr:hypothetical protein EVAR_75979_1 [Eumeta japonica]
MTQLNCQPRSQSSVSSFIVPMRRQSGWQKSAFYDGCAFILKQGHLNVALSYLPHRRTSALNTATYLQIRRVAFPQRAVTRSRSLTSSARRVTIVHESGLHFKSHEGNGKKLLTCFVF